MSNERLNRELIVLGTLINTPQLFYEVSDVLSPLIFSSKGTIDLCEKVIQSVQKYGTIKTNAFARKAESKEFPYSEIIDLVSLADLPGFFDNVEYLKTAYITEQEITLAKKTEGRLQSGEFYEDVLTEIKSERDVVRSVVERSGRSRTDAFAEAKDEVYRTIEAAKKGGIAGISSGIQAVDNLLFGWNKTNLIVVAARPGMGKSTLTFNYALTAAKKGYPAVIFSLEMSTSEMIKKLASMMTGIPTVQIYNGNLTDEEARRVSDATDELYELPIYFEDKLYDLDRIANKVRFYKERFKVELVVLDYLQLINGGKNGRYESITEGSQKCKRIAKESEVVFFMISQLNRKVEERPDKRPKMSDLRESGQIEQDADLIQMIYRPEYYGIENDDEGYSTKGVAEILTLKNRHGMTGIVKAKFNGSFSDLDISSHRNFQEDDYPKNETNLITSKHAGNEEEDDIPF